MATIKLRLPQYELRFNDDAVAAALAEELAESQPPYVVTGMLVRQWYAVHHPKSGPIEYGTAQEQVDAMGEELRSIYVGKGE